LALEARKQAEKQTAEAEEKARAYKAAAEADVKEGRYTQKVIRGGGDKQTAEKVLEQARQALEERLYCTPADKGGEP